MDSRMTLDSQVYDSLSGPDADTLRRLHLSPSQLLQLYGEARESNRAHQQAMAQVFTDCGTCRQNQGLIRRVITAAKRASENRNGRPAAPRTDEA